MKPKLYIFTKTQAGVIERVAIRSDAFAIAGSAIEH
jgi:hypothetical protein